MKIKINEQDISYDMIDDEVIIINLLKGYYYSLQNIAAEIWNEIVNDATLEEIIEIFLEKYDGSKEEITNSLIDFVYKLADEELINISNEKLSNLSKIESKEIQNIQKKKPFCVPTIEKYTDLEELLLLDPIHEVDESGWPKQSFNAK